MKITVIGTGSDGNAFLFNETLMIDSGLTFKKLEESIDISKLKYVLLTHIHGDHFNKTSIRKLHVENENIIFVCGSFLTYPLSSIGIPLVNIMEIEINKPYTIDGFIISGVNLYHDVDNIGYRAVSKGHRHFHATDTSTLAGISAINYDTATIECNHEENRALELISYAKENGDFSHLGGAMASHLSVQQTVSFCERNGIKKLIPVHVGGSTKKEVFEYLDMNFKDRYDALLAN